VSTLGDETLEGFDFSPGIKKQASFFDEHQHIPDVFAKREEIVCLDLSRLDIESH
jgi:hypothetical protein